ncbi:MAG: AraC family transcriptional regulator [Eubacteriales bacterium]|nr:AraC family transcriptional regulator [Eubacteriales bacterium]
MKQSYTEHLTNQEYNTASELWYHAEDRLKQCVECGDGKGALTALSDLKSAVKQRFSPILTPWELTSTLFGILGGILHFACRDAGLPPAYLTLMILRQKDCLSAVFSPVKGPSPSALTQSPDGALDSCVLYACEMVQSFSLPEYSPLVRRCVSYIQQHLTDTLSVDSLAEMAGITRQYLSSQFHKETGKTPTEYINYERIKLSKYYLRQENYSITQIALMCGYGDSNYFGRTFKSITGKTPSAYRSLVKS